MKVMHLTVKRYNGQPRPFRQDEGRERGHAQIKIYAFYNIDNAHLRRIRYV